MTYFKLSTITAALALSLGHAMADTPSIVISGRDAAPTPHIIVRSDFDFEQTISLKVRPDPRYIPSQVLIETVSKNGMVDAKGVSITSGFDIDVSNDAVIGFSGGTAEIIKSARLPDGSLKIISNFKDKNGNYISPPISQIAAYDTGGQKLCFDYQNVTQAPPKMGFVLLVDRSGSMAPVIEEVREATAGFLRSLPQMAECAVASFASDWNYHNRNFEICGTGDFKLETLDADGGSDLYPPLIESYRTLSQSYFDDAQKAIIMITDGIVVDDSDLKLQALVAKKDTLTFSYFLGAQPNDLVVKNLIDGHLHDPLNVSKSLQQYFHTLSQAYKTQKILNVKACNAGGVYVP